MVHNNLFIPAQHGFLQSRNCLPAIRNYGIMVQLYRGRCIDVIYTDFPKAFYSVPHARLISKIESYGITGKWLNWIKAFLGNKKRVKVKDCLSQWTDITNGVHQWSVLGPILFLTYINDLPSQIQKVCNLFVEDAEVILSHH